ncbi:NADH-quinone oxidoreductase subunit K [Macrococcoides caseolyticum]|uniref:NADH-quinone oxidoreductase subunit K n=1 Tax=Macrococcoides caseolyticum TaxID=69966 RepID=UPI001F1AEA9B|nr:NADH-quinone oxidoreductase subunit K [Macrococcus caseolyticus]MCE4956525.1 NADH-quinone oxidoreductase subunit K [Macrococcus caseolyticus]
MMLITIITTILVYVGVNLILSKNLIRVVLGTSILSHAAHLFLISMSYPGSDMPFVDASIPDVDALPQALILTAIVISFATTALLLVLIYKNYQMNKDNQADHLGGSDE